MPEIEKPTSRPVGFPHGRRLLRNIGWNLIGAGAPLVAAVFAVPALLNGLGTDRFGVLTIAWSLIGYFSLFDFGLGRAVTKLVSESIGRGMEKDAPPLIGTALSIMGALGLVACVVLVVLTPWLATSVLKIPPIFHTESVHTFFILAVSIPIVFLTAGLRAVLESYHRFDVANLIRIPLGMWTFLGPLVGLLFSSRLDDVVWVLVAGRVAALVAHLWACSLVRPGFFGAISFRSSLIRPLIRFGGWVTVSNVIGPIMVYFDRFVIGAVLSVAAVAYYTTPYEVVAKLGVLPDAVVGVLFPVFAAYLASDVHRAAKVFDQGMRGLLIVSFPAALILATLSQEALTLWLGGEFSAQSYRIAQWLCAGILLNSFAKIPFALISASGRPDITAKLHMVELPVYLLVLWWLIRDQGVDGAAAAWALRAGADMAILSLIAGHMAPAVIGPARRGILRAGCCLGLILAGAVLWSTTLRVVFLGAVLSGFALYAWTRVMTEEERTAARGWLSPSASRL